MAEKPILFYTEVSPPSRSVRYVAEQIGVDIELRNVNLVEKEQTKDEFKKVNPTQTLPALEDSGFKLFESHAIMAYLVDKYATDDKLYPKIITERAKFNAMLHFETQFLFGRCRNAIESIFVYNAKSLSSDDLDRMKNSLERFEALIVANGTTFLASNHPTIVDFSCIPTITSYDYFVPVTAENFPKIYQWKRDLFNRIPGLEQSETNGFEMLNKILTFKMQANQAI